MMRPSRAVAVKDGPGLGPPAGLVLEGREHDGTLAISERKTTMRGGGARLVTTAILAFPQSL
jgi:hypothetical protein